MAQLPTHVSIAMNDILKRYQVRIHIEGYRWWQMRMNITILLVRLAAWIGGLGIEVDLED